MFVELGCVVFRHIPFSFEIGFAAPVESGPFEAEGSIRGGEGVEDLDCCVGYVYTDTVAGYGWDDISMTVIFVLGSNVMGCIITCNVEALGRHVALLTRG